MSPDVKAAPPIIRSRTKNASARKSTDKKTLTLADRLGDFIGCNTHSGIPQDASVNHKKYLLEAIRAPRVH